MHVAWQCLDEGQQVPLIFSSLYGESNRTFELTEAVANGEQVSPASFSLSVHNAIAGQLSIARKVTCEVSCLSPLGAGVVPALLEAMGLLIERVHKRVLIIFYDCPLPKLYQPSVAGPEGMMACALLISQQGSPNGSPFRSVTLQRQSNEYTASSFQEQESQLLDLIRVLTGAVDSAFLPSSGASWRLTG